MAAHRQTFPETRFTRVALVLPTEYAYARGVLRGVIAATKERNQYGAASRPWLFHVFRGIHGHSSRYLSRWLREWRPDGVICQIYDGRLVEFYRRLGKPVVELFESRATSVFPRILPDDLIAGQVAARHFLDRGFRHFAFYETGAMLWARRREVGFREELERAFRERGGSWTYERFGKGTASQTRSAKIRSRSMGAWLASLPKPLAVFAANDLWGSELVQAARERRVRVPDEVAILGVDNDELLCELSHPPLSSIRLGAEQIGRAAVATLERLMARETVGDVPTVPPAGIVTRQSTECVAVEDPEVAEALRHIRERACAGTSVKELLKVVAVNRRTLERRFVSVLGRTPLDEIRRVRLERAKELLRTDAPIYRVAEASGFGTPEYLATSFLRATGQTPTAYRRRHGVGGPAEELAARLLE